MSTPDTKILRVKVDTMAQKNVNSPGLITFGGFQQNAYKLWELPIFAMIGVVGGLLGGLFCAINVKISHFRRSYIAPKPPLRVLEACTIALLCAAVAFWLPQLHSSECMPVPPPLLGALRCSRCGE